MVLRLEVLVLQRVRGLVGLLLRAPVHRGVGRLLEEALQAITGAMVVASVVAMEAVTAITTVVMEVTTVMAMAAGMVVVATVMAMVEVGTIDLLRLVVGSLTKDVEVVDVGAVVFEVPTNSRVVLGSKEVARWCKGRR